MHRRLPIYLTEYGYETNPPDPFRGVPQAVQAAYLDQAQYMAWRDPRVRAFAQFLLYDAAPDPSYPRRSMGYWSTFQTGLLSVSGTPKPSLGAYRLPIFIPDAIAKRGASMLVWGMLRSAPNHTPQRATVEYHARASGRSGRARPAHPAAAGAFEQLATVSTTDPSGFFTARVKPPAGAGLLRVAWRSPSGAMTVSRSVAVQVR
jgi:hypothetical protein